MKIHIFNCQRWLLPTVITILFLVCPVKQSSAADPVVSATVLVGLTPSFQNLAGIQFNLLNDTGAINSQVPATVINEAASSQFFLVGTATLNKAVVAWINLTGITTGVNPLFQFVYPINTGGYPRFTVDTTPNTISLLDTANSSIAATAANFVVTTAYQTQGGITQYFLNSANTGAGSGTITSTPPGIACTGNCSSIFNASTQVTLIPTLSFDSFFSGWSGGGCSGTGNCVVTMNNETTVTATFGVHPPVNLGTAYYPLVATAYANAVSGNTIKVRAVAVTESPVFNSPIAVTLKGGFDGTFTNTNGSATIHGTVTVTSGTVTIENIIIS